MLAPVLHENNPGPRLTIRDDVTLNIKGIVGDQPCALVTMSKRGIQFLPEQQLCLISLLGLRALSPDDSPGIEQVP